MFNATELKCIHDVLVQVKLEPSQHEIAKIMFGITEKCKTEVGKQPDKKGKEKK